MSTLTDKVAIVTAAASGIGAATVKTMAKKGAAVVLADINREASEAIVKDIEASGGKAIFVKCDIGIEEDIKNTVATAVEHFGKLNIMHNNAALLDPQVFEEDVDILSISTEAWDKTMQTTLRGTMLGCKYAVKEMLKIGGGSIINTSSMYGVGAFYRQTAYGTAKGAINTLTQYVATSYGHKNIRVNAVAPSMVRTKILESIIPEELIKLNEDSVLLPSLGEPQDIANVVAYLASDEASYLTGLVIRADGGTTSHLPTYADARRFYDGID